MIEKCKHLKDTYCSNACRHNELENVFKECRFTKFRLEELLDIVEKTNNAFCGLNLGMKQVTSTIKEVLKEMKEFRE